MRQKSTFLVLLLAGSVFYSTTISAQLIKTYAGTGIPGYAGDGGQAAAAQLKTCTGVAFDGAGNIYVADMGNNVVRKINTYGVISTFAGNDTAGYTGDGGQAASAKLNHPYGVATDAAGNVYIADYGNSAVRIVNPAGIISTFAGTGTPGYAGDNGVAHSAMLSGPEAVAVDQAGNVYIADAGNLVVRKVNAIDSIISTFAGTGYPGYSGDGGPAGYATLSSPASLATDVYGNVYIADYYNQVVRRVDSNGIISTFAGVGAAGYSGDGGQAAMAALNFPSGVSVYGFGNVYIADQGNNVVRVVNTSGVISTFAGTGTSGYNGDGGNAYAAELSSPKGVAVDGLARVFIADYNNNVVRVVYANTPAGVGTLSVTGGFNVYPNPSDGTFMITLPASNELATITLTDVLGRCMATSKVNAPSGKANLGFNVPDGNYVITVTEGGNIYKTQVVVTK